MRKHYLLYASAAMVALASCSREAKEVITPEMTTSYAKISISMATAPGTRAGWGDEFDSGTYEESKMTLEDIHLVFYDENGFVVGSGEHIATGLDERFDIAADPRTGTDSVSDENAVVFKLDLYEGAPLPTKVAAFINVDPMAFNLDKLSDINTNVSDSYKTDKGYIMTSAGYYDGEEYVIAAELNSDGIFTTVSQAAATNATKAAEIYVERLASKVNIDAAANVDQDDQKFIVKNKDGEVLSVEFSAKDFNWGITGTATEMYMLKKPFKNAASWMNDSGNCRSYWAEGSNWGIEYKDYQPEEGDPVLSYLSYNGVVNEGNKNGKESYTLEHTYDYSVLKAAPLFNVNVPTTSAIVIGTYKISNGNQTTDFGEDGFYLLYAGAEDGKSVFTLYSRDELIEYLVNGKTIYDRDGNVVSAFSLAKVGTQFKLVAKTCQVTPNDENDKTYTTLYTDYNDPEKKKEVAKTNARHYVGSMGYFFVPIVHHASSTETVEGVIEPVTGYYGVVRNHSYVLSITSIQGLAAPLDDKYTDKGDDVDPEDPNYPEGGDPDEPIIPDPDDLKEAYIQASIKVLSWHVVSQDVKL